MVIVRDRNLGLGDHAQDPRSGARQARRVVGLELVLLGHLDPGVRCGEVGQPRQPVEVGCRRRLGQHRHPGVRELAQKVRGRRAGHRQDHESRPVGQDLVDRRTDRDAPSVGGMGRPPSVPRQHAGDPEDSRQCSCHPDVEPGAPAGPDDRERHDVHRSLQVFPQHMGSQHGPARQARKGRSAGPRPRLNSEWILDTTRCRV